MKELSSWSPRRVIVACMLWLLGAPVLAAIGLLLGGLVLAAFSGRQPIGFTVNLSNRMRLRRNGCNVLAAELGLDVERHRAG